MAEQNEKRAKLLRSLQNGVNTERLKRVRVEYMDVGPRAQKEQIEVPPGHVEALDAQIAKKIKRNDYEKIRSEIEMSDIIVK